MLFNLLYDILFINCDHIAISYLNLLYFQSKTPQVISSTYYNFSPFKVACIESPKQCENSNSTVLILPFSKIYNFIHWLKDNYYEEDHQDDLIDFIIGNLKTCFIVDSSFIKYTGSGSIRLYIDKVNKLAAHNNTTILDYMLLHIRDMANISKDNKFTSKTIGNIHFILCLIRNGFKSVSNNEEKMSNKLFNMLKNFDLNSSIELPITTAQRKPEVIKGFDSGTTIELPQMNGKDEFKVAG